MVSVVEGSGSDFGSGSVFGSDSTVDVSSCCSVVIAESGTGSLVGSGFGKPNQIKISNVHYR